MTKMWSVSLFGVFFCLLASPAVSQSNHVLRNVPLWFEANVGQHEEDVRFISSGLEQTLWVTRENIGVHFDNGEKITLQLLGTDDLLMPEGKAEYSGKANYMLRDEPSKWVSGVPLFASVRCPRVYDGIDLILHGTQGKLEYDFVVEPFADPSRIRMHFRGAERVLVDSTGNLVICTKSKKMICPTPFAYQGQKTLVQRVDCSYGIDENGDVTFTLGEYDHSLPLTIDPVLLFSSYFQEATSARGIGVDAEGNVYVGGFTHSSAFPVKNAYQNQNAGNLDIFVVKLNPELDTILYATYIGGSNDDDIKAMAVDEKGYVYLGGRTKSPDFPTTEGAFCRVHKATYDNIVAKLHPNGDHLVYSTLLGGESMEEVRGIAYDAEGNCAVVGGTHSTDFPTTPNSFKPVYTDPKEPDPTKKSGKPFTAEDAFVAKFNPSGTGLVFCSFLGGHGYDKAWGCAMDPQGHVFVTGYTGSKDFPVTEGVIQPKHAGGDPSGDFGELDVFVTKFNPDGTQLVFSTLLGGTGNDKGEGVAVDAKGNVFVTGDTSSVDFPTKQPVQPTYAGGDADFFVTKISPDAKEVFWSTFVGGSAEDRPSSHAMKVDHNGNVYVLGSTKSADFMTFNPLLSVKGGGKDAALVMFLASGKLGFSTLLGGTEDEEGVAVDVDSRGCVYLTGYTRSADFPTKNPLTDQSPGNSFVVKLNTAEQNAK